MDFNWMSFTLTVFWLIVFLQQSSCIAFVSENFTRQELLNDLLDRRGYDPRIPPDYELDYPTNVTVELVIMSLDSLDEVSMDYTVDVFLRQRWVDHRLRFEPRKGIRWLELDQKMIGRVWVPDTIFANEKEASFHDITVPNRLMHLFSDGTVKYSVRLSLKLSCCMNLESYPLDMQNCPILIESYGYTTDNVMFYWYKGNPLQIPKNRILPQYSVTNYSISEIRCIRKYDTDGSFSCLEARLHLDRNTGYYIAQIFIPSILIVMLSWVSFWVDAEATPARISLGVLTVLTITTQSSGAREALARVSYIKAIDVWMATCLMFVFASLLEFAYINVLTRQRRSFLMSGLTVGTSGILETNNVLPKVQSKGDMTKRESQQFYVTYTRKARMVDKVSRVLFPTSFTLFNIIFWVYYLSIRNRPSGFTMC